MHLARGGRRWRFVDAAGKAEDRRAPETGQRRVAGGAEAPELRQQPGGPGCGAARRGASTEERANLLARLSQPARDPELAVGGHAERPEDGHAGARVVQMPGEPGDEVRAAPAVGEMVLGLPRLLVVGEARRERLQDRLPLGTPLPPLEGPQALGQLVDPAGDLLAVGTRREPFDQLAHLPGLQPPAVAQHQHRPAAARERGEQVTGDRRLLVLVSPLGGRGGAVADRAGALQRGHRPAPAPPQLLARLARDGREHVAADLVVVEAAGGGRRARGRSRATPPRRRPRSRARRRRVRRRAESCPWPGRATRGRAAPTACPRRRARPGSPRNGRVGRRSSAGTTPRPAAAPPCRGPVLL